jgi:hypothetical protein
MKVTTILEKLNEYSGAIGIALTLLSGLWALLKLTEYLKDKKFQNYHRLIGELVDETSNPDRVIKLDRQIAIIFELRNYSTYYPVTGRILADLREPWKNQQRAVSEIDLTLDFISKNCFVRSYMRALKK